MTTFSSISELEGEIKKCCEKGIEIAADKIHGEISENLLQYYWEYHPDYYIRTGNLFDSLYENVNGLSAEIGFDSSSMHYEQENVPMNTPKGVKHVSATWGAEEVLDTAMRGLHGGFSVPNGTKILNESMAELGDINKLLKNSLVKAGLPIK